MNDVDGEGRPSVSKVVAEALANVAGIDNLEMRKIAFEAELARLADHRKRWERRIGWIASIAAVASVIIGLLISLSEFAIGREKDNKARLLEDATRRQALRQPLIDLRRTRYLEINSTLGTLAAFDQDPDKLVQARRRFWELDRADLSLVEDSTVKDAMVHLGELVGKDEVDPGFRKATYEFAHLIRGRIDALEPDIAK